MHLIYLFPGVVTLFFIFPQVVRDNAVLKAVTIENEEAIEVMIEPMTKQKHHCLCTCCRASSTFISSPSTCAAPNAKGPADWLTVSVPHSFARKTVSALHRFRWQHVKEVHEEIFRIRKEFFHSLKRYLLNTNKDETAAHVKEQVFGPGAGDKELGMQDFTPDIMKKVSVVCFTFFDEDKSEKLQRDEMQDMFQTVKFRISKEGVRRLFHVLDPDGDDVISLEEWKVKRRWWLRWWRWQRLPA